MFNRVVLVGRLTKDPVLSYTKTSVPNATFTIAVGRTFTNQQTGEKEADYIPIVVWRKQAENVKQFTHKGSLVCVEGKIQTRNYEDRDGIRRYVTEVVADNVVFLESKGSDQQSQDYPQEPTKEDQSNDEEKYDSNVTYDDLPFNPL